MNVRRCRKIVNSHTWSTSRPCTAICIWTLPCMEEHGFRLNMSDFLRGWRDYVKRGWGDCCAIKSRLLEYVKGQLAGLSPRQAQGRAAQSCHWCTVILCEDLASALSFPSPKLVAKYRANIGRERKFSSLKMRLWGTTAHQSKFCLQLVSQGVPLPSHNFHLMPFGADAFLLDSEIPLSLTVCCANRRV